jgi:tellurite resistance protein TehA-like permease
MEKKNLVWIILITVILLVIISFAIPALFPASHPGSGQKSQQQASGAGPAGLGQQQQQPPGQEEAKQLKTVISFINLGLIIPLFLIYLGIYRKMRSSFTLGLMAVIFALGMYAVTSNPLLIGLLGGRTGDIGIFQIIPDLCTTVALIILVRISLE